MAEYKRQTKGRKFTERDSRGRRDSRTPPRFQRKSGGRKDPQERTRVTCDSCKQKCEVPFKPTSNKPVYCSDCFRKDSGSSSGGRDLAEINKKLDKIMYALEID